MGRKTNYLRLFRQYGLSTKGTGRWEKGTSVLVQKSNEREIEEESGRVVDHKEHPRHSQKFDSYLKASRDHG